MVNGELVIADWCEARLFVFLGLGDDVLREARRRIVWGETMYCLG